MKLDNLDLEIIKFLQKDARMSFRDIGKKLDVPHTTIFTRAERLLKKGVIKNFAAVLHPHELGLQMGYVIVDAPPSESKELAAKISEYNEAMKIFRTFDGKILVKFVVKGENHNQGMEEFLTKLSNYPMKTYPIYDIVKFENSLHPEILKEIIEKK